MSPMRWRTALRRSPYYENSLHIVNNERTVTRIDGQFRGRPLPCYVEQIAGRSVNGIAGYVSPNQEVRRGAVFGMIRIGSQVDTIDPWTDDMQVKVRPGERVRASESAMIE